jgi:glyoxylase-like metal-dependent hydrolase (beta-lactamase superfamily II)
MNIGKFSIEHLSEGQFEIYHDGTLSKKESPSVRRKIDPSDELFPDLFTNVGIDPILVRSDDTIILLDAGLGQGLDEKRKNPRISNIRTNLEIFDIRPEDVDHVIISHLHHDHVAGLTHGNNTSAIKSTLQNAKIWVQRSEWEFALEMLSVPNELSDVPYQLDDLYRLVSDGQIHFVDDAHFEVVPGVELIRTGGHTPGHQIVRIKDDGKTAYYFGDLIPNEQFLNFKMMRNADVDVTESRQIKMLLMKQAFHESAEILFYHSVHLKHGKLEKDLSRHYVLKDQ